MSYAINIEWYNEIKDLVPTENPWYYENHTMVEVDILDEAEFVRVSTELGWMV